MEKQILDKKILDALKCIKCNTAEGAAEANAILNDILTAVGTLVTENKIDFELAAVKDSEGTVWQMVFEKDEATGAINVKYIGADGTPGAVVGGVTFLDPILVLTNILTALATIYTNLQLNTISVANIDTKLAPQPRTHITLSLSAVGAVPVGSLCGSVLNAGNAAGVWNGIPIPAGVSIPWQPIGNRDVYGAIPFDGTGTLLIIEFTL